MTSHFQCCYITLYYDLSPTMMLYFPTPFLHGLPAPKDVPIHQLDLERLERLYF
jgi:hypothetical protein